MQKDFEAKKQEIADYIEHNFRLDGNPKMDNTHKYVIKSVNAQKLVSMINDLQPPKPPTCSTCDHCEHHEIDCGEGMLSDCYRCLSDKLDWNMLPYIEEPTNFGCIHHSDYEVAE